MDDKKIRKKLKLFNWLGCDRDEFRRHIESLWEPGMSWDNYGPGAKGWHIDHIKPKSSVHRGDEAAYRAICHYTNLRPLWGLENARKGVRERYTPRGMAAQNTPEQVP